MQCEMRAASTDDSNVCRIRYADVTEDAVITVSKGWATARLSGGAENSNAAGNCRITARNQGDAHR